MAVTAGAIMLALSLWREESRPASNRLSSPPRF
jgi:hypothetical protein